MTMPDGWPGVPTYWENTAAELLVLLLRQDVAATETPVGVRIGDGPVYPLNDARMVDGALVVGWRDDSAPQEPGPDREREVSGEEREPQPDEVHGVRVDAERGEQEADGGSESKHGRGVPGDRRGES